MRMSDAPFIGLSCGVSTTQPPVFTTDTGDGHSDVVRTSTKGLWVWPKTKVTSRGAPISAPIWVTTGPSR